MELTEDALLGLGIIHCNDVRKVLNQMKVVADKHDKFPDLQKMSSAEYTELVSLMEKYLEMLKDIKLKK